MAKTSMNSDKSKMSLETEDELEARKTWHHHRFVEKAKQISTVRSKSEERSNKDLFKVELPKVTAVAVVVEEVAEKVPREGRVRSRNGSNFRRRCRSNDVMLSQLAGATCGSMSSLEMDEAKKSPYSDFDINSMTGNNTVYSEVTFLPGGFRSFPRPPRVNPSSVSVVAKHVAAIDAGEKPVMFNPPTPSPPQVQKVYEQVPMTESSGSDQEQLKEIIPPPVPFADECLGLQAMMIKPPQVGHRIEIVKVPRPLTEEEIMTEVSSSDSLSSATSSEVDVQSVIDSSCYERHDIATSYVCTEVTALDKIDSGKCVLPLPVSSCYYKCCIV